jgi:phage terminase small subunit
MASAAEFEDLSVSGKTKRARRPAWNASELTEKQKAFAAEYLVDMNATNAARRAGYSVRTAGAEGCKLLRLPKISAAIETAQRERAQRVEITANMVVQELAKIAFSNMSDYVTVETVGKAKGQVSIDLSCLTRDQFAAIGEIRIEDIESGKRTGKRTTFKLLDKRQALVDLGKHLGLFVERKQVEHSGTIDIENAARDFESKLLEAAASVATGTDSRKLN